MSTLNKNASARQEIKVTESNNLNKRASGTSSSSQDNIEYDSTEEPIVYQKPRKII